MKYYLYIILTESDTLYCGIALDPIKRFNLHKEGKGAKYTKSHKPKQIVYLQSFIDKNSALKEEYRIKHKLTKAQKLKLIEENKLSSQRNLEACRLSLEEC